MEIERKKPGPTAGMDQVTRKATVTGDGSM